MLAVSKERDDTLAKNLSLKEALREARQRFEYLEEETGQMQAKMASTEEAMVAALGQLERERDESKQKALELSHVIQGLQKEAQAAEGASAAVHTSLVASVDSINELEEKYMVALKRAAEMEDRLLKLAGDKETAEDRFLDFEEQITRFRELEPRMLHLIAEKNKSEEMMFQVT